MLKIVSKFSYIILYIARHSCKPFNDRTKICMLLKLQQTGGVVCCVFLSQLLVEREKERITKVLCIQIEAKEDSTEIIQEREKRSGRAQRLAQSEASQILIIDSSRGRGWRLYSCPMPSRTCPHFNPQYTTSTRPHVAHALARLFERSRILPAPPRPVLTNSPGRATCAGAPSGRGAGLLVTFARPPRPVE